MARTVDDIAAEVLALPPEARVDLVDRIVESLDPVDDPEIRSIWAAEAMRRIEEVESGKVTPIPMDEALADLRREFGEWH